MVNLNKNKKKKKTYKRTKIVGDCPYCDGQVGKRDTKIYNRKVSIYSCENNKVAHNDDDDEGSFLQTDDSTCSFKIFSNALLKYNKGTISEKEIKELLLNKEIVVRLYSKKLFNEETDTYGSEYFRYVITDEEYGISVLFDMEVEEKTEEK